MTVPAGLLLLIPALLSGVASWLLAESALQGAAAVTAALGHRWGRGRLVISRSRGAEVALGQQRVRFGWRELLPFLGGVGLALLWRYPLLSLWSLALGGGGLWVQRRTARRQPVAERAAHELFLNALRSRYEVNRSLLQALQGAIADLDLPESQVTRAAQAVVQQLRAGTPVSEAVASLGRLPVSVLQQLAIILGRSELASETELRVLLAELEARARQARRLADRVQVTLATTRTTLYVLTVVAVTLASLAALLPLWRAYYVRQPSAYVAATLLALSGYAYFALKIQALEESL